MYISMTVRGLLLYAISLQMEIADVCRLCLVCGRDWCIRIALTPVNAASVIFAMLCVLAFMCNMLEYCTVQVMVLHLGENGQSSKLCTQLRKDIGPCARKRGYFRSTPSA